MALTIGQIAEALAISRAEFGRIFLQAQVDAVENPADRVLFEAVATSGDDREAFVEGLKRAEQGGFLEGMVRSIVADGLEDGRIAAARAAEAAQSADGNRKATLEAMADLARGFPRPEVAVRGLNVGMRWTVRVLIDGGFRGTGILIGPHLVLTAWHVVRELFDPAGGNKFTAKAHAAARLSVEFDDLSGLLDAHAPAPVPQRITAHVQWYATHSECHPEELQERIPANAAELDGFWDYAILRLARTPGLERRWAALDAHAVVPPAEGRIVVFQYPAGQPMRFAEGQIVAPEPAVAAAVPRCRFLHAANSLRGSSGGPCFDRAFMLFGLHQGEWTRAAGAGGRVNRGVPIIRIKEHIQQSIRDLPVPDPSESPVWKLCKAELEAPVVGCDPFQTLVWTSAVTGKPRLVLIGGDPGRGKTFRLSVLSAMLPDSGHLKVGLLGEAISKLNALQLATEICRKAGAQPPNFLTAAEFNTTVSTWLRDEVVEKVIRALEGVRNQRLVWITLAELNKTDIQGEDASPFLLALYEQTRNVDWLRIVLDGMKGDPPQAARGVTERHRATEVTHDEIKTYIRRATAEYETPVEDVVVRLAGAAWRRYDRRMSQAPATALEELSEVLQDLVGRFLD